MPFETFTWIGPRGIVVNPDTFVVSLDENERL